MRNKWLWFAVVLAIVIAAFLFPRVMLWIEQKNAQDYVLRHGMGTLLNFNELKLSEKQSLLASEKLTLVEEQNVDTDALLKGFYSELELLHTCGALNEELYSLSCELFSRDMVTVYTYHAFDTTGGSFRLCELRGRTANACYDMETGKILRLALHSGTEAFLIFSEAEEKSVTPTQSLQAQLRSWAEYYGMRAGDITPTDLQDGTIILFAQCAMHDGTDGSFTFAAGTTDEDGSIFFAAVPNETDSIQEGA